jgi:nitrite reductase (NO-forming)
MKHLALLAVAALGCSAIVHAGNPDVSAALASTRASVAHEEIRGEERASMTSAPNVPPPLNRRHATKVLLDVEASAAETSGLPA